MSQPSITPALAGLLYRLSYWPTPFIVDDSTLDHSRFSGIAYRDWAIGPHLSLWMTQLSTTPALAGLLYRLSYWPRKPSSHIRVSYL